METKHTKGEWEVAHDEKIGYFITNPKEWGRICTIRSVREPNWEANARLIAAAPELLEALQNVDRLYSEIERLVDGEVLEMLNKVRNAINKATK